jgi:hypothetical protein
MFTKPLANRLQVHRVVPKCLHQLNSFPLWHTGYDLCRTDVYSGCILVHFAQPFKWACLFYPPCPLAFFSHVLLLVLDGQNPVTSWGLASSSGSLPPGLQCINQFDRQPRCTSGLRLCVPPLLCTACCSVLSEYTLLICRTVSRVKNEPRSFVVHLIAQTTMLCDIV